MSSWRIALGVGGAVLLFWLWHAQRSRHAFDLRDVLLDSTTGKASLANVTLVFFMLLAAWVVVDRELRDLPDVMPLLLGVLGIFVVGKGAKQAIDAFATNAGGPTTVRETREITVPAGGDPSSTTTRA